RPRVSRPQRAEQPQRRGDRPQRGERPDRAHGDRPDRDPALRAKYIKGRGEGRDRRDREPDPNSPFAKRAPLKEQLEATTKEARGGGGSLARQRIDKWLWHARVVRTRTAAAELAAAGHVRINGRRVDAPSHAVRAGDVVTVALDRAVRVLKVVAFA